MLLCCAIASAICLAIVEVVADSPLKIGAGVLLALLLPGYAISVLTFPVGSVETASRALTVAGASLSAGALGGLLLNLLPGGMHASHWAFFFTALTLLALAGAWLRDANATEPRPAGSKAPPGGRRTAPRGTRPSFFLPVIFGVTAVCLVVLAVLVAREAANRQSPFAELSAVPAHGEKGGLLIDLRSHEEATTSFSVVVSEAGGLTSTFDVRLRPGGVWRHLEATTGNRRVDVNVYKDETSEPYLRASYSPQATR